MGRACAGTDHRPGICCSVPPPGGTRVSSYWRYAAYRGWISTFQAIVAVTFTWPDRDCAPASYSAGAAVIRSC